MKAFLIRLLYCVVKILLGVDMTVCTTLVGAFYTLTGKCKPDGRLSISGLVGWAASRGYGWGIALQAVIDAIMLDSQHCQQAAVSDAPYEATL